MRNPPGSGAAVRHQDRLAGPQAKRKRGTRDAAAVRAGRLKNRMEVLALSIPGPGGPGNHYAAPPGLVFWVNRKPFTRPTSWHGRPARVKPRWFSIFFELRVAVALFRPEGPTSQCRWRRQSVGTGGSLPSSSPGASRPRQSLCRPSGAGVLGKQRVARETQNLARASRPCGAKMPGDFVRNPLVAIAFFSPGRLTSKYRGLRPPVSRSPNTFFPCAPRTPSLSNW
jgi:hypothetical protein